ncbi:hypothetical protein B0H15DRAFT_925413 [Mycena belliarum]|uniref:Uncharacterized protein n=1 Tax=Mycena belliarum TaxID=1033014 RepID=A0AAD6TSS9_9AGAR|nr:hypothetical protein B0H15DRAFT_925413 [Mycena belliae]
MERRYTFHSVGAQSFCSPAIFRSAWFAYARLQYLDGDMQCVKCGPSPENTIWDGPTSIIRNATLYVPDQKLMPDTPSRKLVQKVVNGPPIKPVAPAGVEHEGDSDSAVEDDNAGDDEGGGHRPKLPKGTQQILERLEAVPKAVTRLAGTNPPLSRLFERHFGIDCVYRGIKAPDVYKRLFIQISAEESVLQMANGSALEALQIFVKDPNRMNATALIDIPVLHEVLVYEFDNNGGALPTDLIEVCIWILEKGNAVLRTLKKDIQPLKAAEGPVQEKPWMETGCCYGMPKVRERPAYPKLKYDTKLDAGGKRGAKCSKFYSQYGERKLTGGIMCAWCTHSICYGFHCIPKGEGRNDVFSALVTRWESAPKRVVYDFACALGPYCMTREPAFFADTQFVIDDFHSTGHSKCAPAAFLKTYCAVDPRLRYINTSAGECGNSGISRIRKSVSYMSQDRAIVYTKVFLSIWNRQIIRGMGV